MKGADGTAIQPCPQWCTGDDELPSFPEDGFWHYGAPAQIIVQHGRGETSAPEPLMVQLKAWVSSMTAEPQPPLIGLSLNLEEGPNLTPCEARQLAQTLLQLADQAESPGT
jgi:hypothetical protein